jgi:hypothetical protein
MHRGIATRLRHHPVGGLLGISLSLVLLAGCGSVPSSAPSAPAAEPAAQQAIAPTSAIAATETPAPTASPAPTETPAPTATPTPEPVEPGVSRSNPVPLGTELRFETWSVTLTSVQRGEEAAQAISAANQFNEPAPEGYQYLLANVKLQNISSEQKAQPVSFGVDIRLTGSRNVLYSQASVVKPQPLEGELFPEGVAEGQVAFLAPADEQQLVFRVGETLSFDASAYRFVAGDEGAALMPAGELAQIAPTDLGTKRATPAPLGEAVVTDAWEVRVVEVKRGEEAVAMVAEANQFNEAAPEGSEYILVKLQVRYIGGDDPDTAQPVDGSLFKITGEQNTVYDRPSVVPPAPVLDATLFAGGQLEGWTVLSVAAGEQNLALVFEPLFDLSGESLRFLALQ